MGLHFVFVRHFVSSDGMGACVPLIAAVARARVTAGDFGARVPRWNSSAPAQDLQVLVWCGSARNSCAQDLPQYPLCWLVDDARWLLSSPKDGSSQIAGVELAGVPAHEHRRQQRPAAAAGSGSRGRCGPKSRVGVQCTAAPHRQSRAWHRSLPRRRCIPPPRAAPATQPSPLLPLGRLRSDGRRCSLRKCRLAALSTERAPPRTTPPLRPWLGGRPQRVPRPSARCGPFLRSSSFPRDPRFGPG